MKFHEIKEFLDEKVNKYNRPFFIETDPIQVPGQFNQKENIEIAAFFASTLSWGNRTAIINNAKRLMEMMDNQPYAFICEASDLEIQ
ncbi:MAG: DUF2400 family protein, partial [Mariniphaga sp.]|nr:DUF2400 family protein [Mariniphaga sp.]